MSRAPFASGAILLGCLAIGAAGCHGGFERREIQTGENGFGEIPAASLEARLEHAIREGWRDGHLLVECRRDGRLESVEVFPSAVGIWERSRQFELSPGGLRQILEMLRDAGFAAMDEVYGGSKPAVPSHQGFVIVCRVAVEIDGVSKSVVQRRRGERSKDLERLAAEILDHCRARGQAGVAAGSLGEAIRMLRDGSLKPEAWRLSFHRKVTSVESEAFQRGWLIQIEGRRLTTRERRADGTLGPRYTRRLGDGELAALFAVLEEADLETLPENLWIDGYSDISVRVLEYRSVVQARPFSAMDPATHRGGRERFERVAAHLRELHEESLRVR